MSWYSTPQRKTCLERTHVMLSAPTYVPVNRAWPLLSPSDPHPNVFSPESDRSRPSPWESFPPKLSKVDNPPQLNCRFVRFPPPRSSFTKFAPTVEVRPNERLCVRWYVAMASKPGRKSV